VNCESSELIAVKSHESSEFVELTDVSNFESISAPLPQRWGRVPFKE